MTVYELIEWLTRCDPQSNVMFYMGDHDEFIDLDIDYLKYASPWTGFSGDNYSGEVIIGL